MNTVKDHLIEKTKLLKNNFIKLPKLEARLLLSKALQKDFHWTFTNLEKLITKKDIKTYESLIKKKIEKVPTAYLLGIKEFYSMNFIVTKDTLIPRPETEMIVDQIKKHFKDNDKFTILDLGTGSGCILLSLLNEFRNALGIGIDKNIKTLKIAKKNAVKNNLLDRVKFAQINWNEKNFLKKILNQNNFFFNKNKVDLVVANPPYLLKKEINKLEPEIKYEPKRALFDGCDGLNSYRKIIPKLKYLLTDKGTAYFEINPLNIKKIKNILKKNNFKKIKVIKDLSKKNRFISLKI